jgi:hypothetical protein
MILQELLDRMKRNEKDQTYHEQLNIEYINIYYRHPVHGNLKQIHLSISMNYTFAQVTEAAYNKVKYDIEVELNQCRIVSYFASYDLVDQVYDDNVRLDKLCKDPLKNNFLLDIRQSSKFELYPPDPVITKVSLNIFS